MKTVNRAISRAKRHRNQNRAFARALKHGKDRAHRVTRRALNQALGAARDYDEMETALWDRKAGARYTEYDVI